MKTLMTFFISFLIFNIHAFTLNNNLNLSFSQNEVPVFVANNLCDNIGLTENELVELVNRANQQYWNTVSTSRLKLKAQGLANVSADYGTEPLCTGSGTSCSVNPQLAFSSGILIACNDDTTVNFPNSGLLAVTVPTSISGKNINGAVLLLNDTLTNTIDGKSKDEVVALLAHELGHAIGLGHSPVRDSLMYYLSIPTRRNLGWDDIDGVTYLYPKEQPVSCGSVLFITSDKNDQGHLTIGMALGFLLMILVFRAYAFSYKRWSNKFEGIFNNQ